jgi:AcrR family transcriptional regulator
MVGSDDGGSGRLRKTPLSNPERRREVMEAVLSLVAEVGYERLTFDLVAQRARASKATLYQRWPSKAHLVVDAMGEHRPVLTDRDCGSFAEDIRHLLRTWLSAWTVRDRGLMIALLEGGRVDEDLNLLRKQRLGSPARSAMTAALTRARERGEIPRAVDTEMLLELPLAMVLSHVLIIGDGADLDLADRIVDGILVPLLESPKPVPH